MPSNELPAGFGPNDPTAHTQAETEFAVCDFKITQFSPTPDAPDGLPWIWIRTDDPGLSVLKYGDAFLGLQFKSGVTFEDAKRLANEMDRMIEGIACTKFVT